MFSYIFKAYICWFAAVAAAYSIFTFILCYFINSFRRFINLEANDYVPVCLLNIVTGVNVML